MTVHSGDTCTCIYLHVHVYMYIYLHVHVIGTISNIMLFRYIISFKSALLYACNLRTISATDLLFGAHPTALCIYGIRYIHVHVRRALSPKGLEHILQQESSNRFKITTCRGDLLLLIVLFINFTGYTHCEDISVQSVCTI